MRILIVGGGGREHALAWRLAHEGHDVFGAPGNPGIAKVGQIVVTTDYLAVARSIEPDLTVVGPEAPLVAGVADEFRRHNRLIVGAARDVAQLEGSKIYAKQVMQRLGIPTAQFAEASSTEEGLRLLAAFDPPIVVKADGLAAGKGVIVAQDRRQAEAAVRSLGPRLVIEEFLRGEEVSFIALCDGRTAVGLEPTQDHKTVGDNDTGPNTGGMGAYCDGRIVSAEMSKTILDTVIRPVVEATGFAGFLYAGLMMTRDGPKVLEFNVRLGDPETQPLMHRIDSSFADTLMAAATAGLAGVTLRWKKDPSVCVVMAAAGYPGEIRSGDAITGIEEAEQKGAAVFLAGTKVGPHGLETAGGRVLGVTASGADLPRAIASAYAAVGAIHFSGAHYRRDIGAKGLARWTTASASRIHA